jgi:hypothetical protein
LCGMRWSRIVAGSPHRTHGGLRIRNAWRIQRNLR